MAPGLTEDQAVAVVIEALYDAADDDSATGGPDLTRQIYPVVFAVTADGIRRIPDSSLEAIVRALCNAGRTHLAPDARRPDRVRPPAEPGDQPMSMPFYASAEQIMRDRSEYARKGIARGRSVVVLTYADGVLFVAENPSPSTLHKVSEIYDRIGFAAVGKYNEFENLRVAGIRLADLRGYSYDRRDVTARALANAYSQTLGSIFTEQQKPYEVELCVAEVGPGPAQDQLYRLSYDGTIVDEPNFLVMGGQADAVAAQVKDVLPDRPAAG